MICKFIWLQKKPHIGMTLLKQSARERGLAVPDIGSYYHAAVLKLIMPWWNKQNFLCWHMEQIGLKIPVECHDRHLQSDKTQSEAVGACWWGFASKAL